MNKANVIKTRDAFKNAGVKIQVFGDNSNVYDERYDVFIWDDENELLYVIQRVKTQTVFEYSDPANAAYYSILEYDIIQYMQAVSGVKQLETLLPTFGNETEERREKIVDWVEEVASKRIDAKPGTDTKLDLARNNPVKFDAVYGAGSAAKYLKAHGVKIADEKFSASTTKSFQSIVNSVSPLQEIVIDSAVTIPDTITIPNDKKVTINLNGNDLSMDEKKVIKVDGELIIRDTEGTGALKAKEYPLFVQGDGKLIIESGKIESESSYVIYAADDGSVLVEGGELVGEFAPLSGNNTTEDMNYKITGGVITARKGPAIYMPGQGKLDISGGTFNGGLSVRMGQINISGGKFVAVTSDIDNPADYYFYNGNAWLPDALYVMGGTYKSANDKLTNALTLNITGGEFVCQNDQGSAIALYDCGKVAQRINVKISKNVKMSTAATTRHDLDILTLKDIGVTNPKPGFNNPAYVGKMKVTR